MVQEVAIGTGAASRKPRYLARLFADKLDGLEASETNPLSGVQAGLTQGAGEVNVSTAALPEMLDRLRQRVTLSRMYPLDSHWPEYAVALGAAFVQSEPHPRLGRTVRPMRLLREPIALAVTAEVLRGLQLQLRFDRTLYRVLRAIGPLRLEPEWWGEDENRSAHDYYRVQTVEGPCLWICRLVEPGPSPRWYLHGELACEDARKGTGARTGWSGLAAARSVRAFRQHGFKAIVAATLRPMSAISSATRGYSIVA